MEVLQPLWKRINHGLNFLSMSRLTFAETMDSSSDASTEDDDNPMGSSHSEHLTVDSYGLFDVTRGKNSSLAPVQQNTGAIGELPGQATSRPIGAHALEDDGAAPALAAVDMEVNAGEADSVKPKPNVSKWLKDFLSQKRDPSAVPLAPDTVPLDDVYLRMFRDTIRSRSGSAGQSHEHHRSPSKSDSDSDSSSDHSGSASGAHRRRGRRAPSSLPSPAVSRVSIRLFNLPYRMTEEEVIKLPECWCGMRNPFSSPNMFQHHIVRLQGMPRDMELSCRA